MGCRSHASIGQFFAQSFFSKGCPFHLPCGSSHNTIECISASEHHCLMQSFRCLSISSSDPDHFLIIKHISQNVPSFLP